MKLSTGHFIQVRQVATRYYYYQEGEGPHPSISETVHVVDFYESEEAHRAGAAPLARQDFIIQWHGPHPNPGPRLKRLLEWHSSTADRHCWRDKQDSKAFWCGAPDRHGILDHESMQPFKEVS